MEKYLFILVIAMLGASAFAAGEKEGTLANDGDFIVMSDIESPSQYIFLSYTGARFNHCGIALRTHGFSGVTGNELNKVIAIVGDETAGSPEIGEVKDGRLVSALDPNETSFGAFFKIQSRSGKKLKDVLKTDVLVEILDCK